MLGAGVFIGLPLLALAALLLFFDVNRFKPTLEQEVLARTQRTLSIQGDLSLSVWPQIGLRLPAASLSEPGKPQATFLSLKSAHLSAALLPLLKRQVQVDRVSIDGLQATLARDAQGRWNFDDLLKLGQKPGPTDAANPAPAPQAPAPHSPAQPVSFDVQGIALTAASLTVKDAQAGLAGQISALNLKSGRLAPGLKTPVDFSAQLDFSQPKVKAATTLAGTLMLDPAKGDYAFERAKLQFDGDALEFSGLKLALSGAQIEFAQSAQVLTLRDTQLDVSATAGPLAKLALSLPTLKADLAKTELAAEGLKLAAQTRGASPLAVDLSAPALKLAPGAAQSAAISGTLKRSGEQPADATVRIEGLAWAGQRISAANLRIDGTGKLGVREVAAQIAGALGYDLQAQSLSASRLKLTGTYTDPAVPGGKLPFDLAGDLALGLKAQRVTAQLKGKLDKNAIDLDATVNGFAKPAIAFNLGLDQFDVDAWTQRASGGKTAAAPAAGAPAGTQAGTPVGKPTAAAGQQAAAPINLDFLNALNAQGRLRVGDLKVANIRSSNVQLPVKIAGGVARIDGAVASLYGGRLQADASVAAAGNAITLKANLSDVQILPLLKDAVNKDVLEGRGTVVVDLNTRGADVPALKRGLAGSINANLKDGAVKGINLAKSLRDARGKLAALRGAAPGNEGGKASGVEKTDFSEMIAKFTAKDGVLSANELLLRSPFVRATEGNPARVDLGAEQLDFVVKATLVSTSTGQGGRDTGLKEITVPVRLHGPFTAPDYSIQWAAVSSDTLKQLASERLQPQLDAKKAEVQKQVDARKDELRDKAKDRLKGLLGR
jgi:AsmA protein